MKKLLLFLLILSNCIICNAGGISKEVLIANSWKVVYPDFTGRKIYIITFRHDNTMSMKVTYIRHSETYTFNYLYFLADKCPTTFDIEKNAENKSGRYVVSKNKNKIGKSTTPSFCWEIISTDKNIIEFRDEAGQKWILERQ